MSQPSPPEATALPPASPRAPWRLYLVLWLIGVLGYGALAYDRLGEQSASPHFVFQADAWLHGRLSIEPPHKGDDWARVETVVLDDGTRLEGRRLASRPTFRALDGHEVENRRIAKREGKTTYVSFPPFPAALMLPIAALGGRDGHDVWLIVVIAGLVLPLLWSILAALDRRGTAPTTISQRAWLCATLAFGSVMCFAAVQGSVWFAAHVVGVVLALAYVRTALDAAHPWLAGLALGCAAITRTPMAFMFPLFLLELWRTAGGQAAFRADPRGFIRTHAPAALRFAIPVAAIAVIAMVHNAARFGSPFEFGHSFLEVRQQAQIEAHGLFSYQYLSRNLAVAFTLLPELPGRAPWIQVSGHGLAIWVTTPILLALLWPHRTGGLHRNLWITVACVAIPTFFYQNSGWFQFGYRFSLDYLPMLIVLLAVGGRPLGRGAKLLMIAGIVINLFGAITFGRHGEYYRGNYDVIVAH